MSSGVRQTVVCKGCGEKFSALSIKVRAGRAKFHSKECYDKHRASSITIQRQQAVFHQKKHKYGLSKDEYLLLFEKQNNCCAICNISFDVKRAVVDHCHNTGRVRGLLCNECNTLLGMAKENDQVLIKAAEYLRV